MRGEGGGGVKRKRRKGGRRGDMEEGGGGGVRKEREHTDRAICLLLHDRLAGSGGQSSRIRDGVGLRSRLDGPPVPVQSVDEGVIVEEAAELVHL